MVTVYKLQCQGCGYEYPTPLEQMEDMPTSCSDCGNTSFNVFREELEIEDEVRHLRNKTDFSDLDVWELEDYEQERSHYRD